MVQQNTPFQMASVRIAMIMSQIRKEHIPFGINSLISKLQFRAPSTHPVLSFIGLKVSWSSITCNDSLRETVQRAIIVQFEKCCLRN
jgi:hypothetical protein